MGEELKTDSFEATFGGGAAITAAAAARLGRQTGIATVWGDSPLDTEARSRLADFGVDHRYSAQRPGMRSGLTVSVSTRDDRYFLTSPGANRYVEGHLLSATALSDFEPGDHLHFALTPSSWEPFQDLILSLKKQDVTTSWDLGWDPAAAEARAFQRLRSSLDILFLNEKEALRYTSARSLEDALNTFSSQPNTVVVKLGSRGAVACQRGQRFQAAPPQVEALETTGAGDAFNGGFLHLWMNGESLQDCLVAGNICGACSTRAPGGISSLPSADEFRGLKIASVTESGVRVAKNLEGST